MSKLTITFLLINFLALASSIYLFFEFEILNKENLFFCDLTKVISCSKVNLSQYAYFLGIPFSFWGIIYFTLLLIIFWQRKKTKKLLFWYNLFGVLFIPYFVYAEIQLKTICQFCLVVHLALLISLYISWKLVFYR